MTGPNGTRGVLALIGGNEWGEGATFDAELLAASGSTEVALLPTAAAFEHPERAVEHAEAWFSGLGATVRPVMILDRRGASDPDLVGVVSEARFLYIGGGSPMHLRSVLKASPAWDALVAAWKGGAVLAASSAGAMVLGDPMVDPRGGAYTVGLGLVTQLAVIPHFGTAPHERTERSIALAPAGVVVVGVPERTALIRDPSGSWRSAGVGDVTVYAGGGVAGLDALEGM